MASIHDIYAARVAEGTISHDPAQDSAVCALDALKTDLEAARPVGRGLFRKKRTPGPGGIYLWGGVGRGKSMLMDMFVESLAIDDKDRVHFHEFMQSVHAGINEARTRGVDDALAPVADDLAARLRCLALDEMQITDITDAMLVGRLFQRLLDAGVVVVTTSNRPPTDLYKDGLNRALFLPFIDLIQTRMKVMELSGTDDHRQNRLEAAQSYFCPADADAAVAIDAIWDSLTGGASGTLELTVKGRKVRLSPFHNAAARATFHELCGQPLGPADYLAIAAAVRVLVVERIPQLSHHNFNEARRFVILIDALYEARVRLIASAAAPPDRLYLEGEGTFEFARTASRLVEMQSADWTSEN